jgi:hypothetical protein
LATISFDSQEPGDSFMQLRVAGRFLDPRAKNSCDIQKRNSWEA